MQARHEIKHRLNYMDYMILRGRLSAVLPHDRHVNEDGAYRIRSLYFDTPGDQALREKIDGINRREKFRIRRYNQDNSFLQLEKKSKVNGLCYKQSACVSQEEVVRLLSGDTCWMVQNERPLVAELYSKISGNLLRPKSIVDYIREPFVYKPGNVRVTFDRDVRTGLLSTDFFSDNLPTIAAGDELVLLEVKYDAFFPGFIADLLQLESRHAAACSKYALSRIYG
jgi:hypothetical protein